MLWKNSRISELGGFSLCPGQKSGQQPMGSSFNKEPFTSTLGQFSTLLTPSAVMFIHSFICLFFLHLPALICQSSILRICTNVEHCNLNGASTTEAGGSLLWVNRIASKVGFWLTHHYSVPHIEDVGAYKKEPLIVQIPAVVLWMYFTLWIDHIFWDCFWFDSLWLYTVDCAWIFVVHALDSVIFL